MEELYMEELYYDVRGHFKGGRTRPLSLAEITEGNASASEGYFITSGAAANIQGRIARERLEKVFGAEVPHGRYLNANEVKAIMLLA